MTWSLRRSPHVRVAFVHRRRVLLGLMASVLAGCALSGQTHSPMPSEQASVPPSVGETATPSRGEGQTYDGQLLGVTITDLDALAAELGLECDHEPMYDDFTSFCRTRTPEFETPEWFMISGHTSGDEAYNLSIFTSTAPPNEQASRDAVADIVETLMPWIADLGWYRSGDFDCGAGRRGDREFDNFGPEYSMCASSSAGDGTRSQADLDIATEPEP